MATKQTEELGYYCGKLEHLEDDTYLEYADILAFSEWENKRISMPKLVEYIQKKGIGEDYNDSVGFVGKYITIDKIKSSGKTTRGVCFPNGISLTEGDITESWIGYWQITPSGYGFDGTTAIPANVCYGTFGMETAYIQDLYVKNLHTADSSGGSSSEMETATIKNLTTDTLTPKESCGLIHIGGGISFDSDVYGIFKFENGTYCFDSDIKVGDSGNGSLTAELVNTNELSPKSTNPDGDFAIDMYGGFRFVNVRPNPKYLIAGTDDNAVFNSNGGLTEIYSQTEIDTKLQPIEQIKSVFKGSLGDFNSTSAFRTALNNMIADKKEAGRYYATFYGSLIFVTLALLDKSSGTYSQWVEGSIIKGTDGELYLNNELGVRICGRVGLGNTWGVWRANVLDDELPIAATKSHDGLMSKEDKTALESMKENLDEFVKVSKGESEGFGSTVIKVDEIGTKNYPNVIFNSGITFHGNPNYSLIKYREVDLSLYGYKQGSITAHDCFGAFVFNEDTYVIGTMHANDVTVKEDENNSFSLVEKIKALEARIAALESK